MKGVPLPHFEKSSVEACGVEVLELEPEVVPVLPVELEVLVVVVDVSLEVGLVEVVEVLVGGASTDGAD